MDRVPDDQYAHANLFLALILDHPAWYFLVEVTFLNLVLAYTLIRQDRLCRLFQTEIENLA